MLSNAHGAVALLSAPWGCSRTLLLRQQGARSCPKLPGPEVCNPDSERIFLSELDRANPENTVAGHS